MVVQTKRVLVVEDEENWQKLVGDLLTEVAEGLGCAVEVVSAYSFTEALGYISTTPFDCITLDNKLQTGKVGYTLLDRIAHLGRKVPVVVLSGVVEPNNVRDFFKDYSVEEFFWKNSFRPQEFREAIKRLLGQAIDTGGTIKTGGIPMDWSTVIAVAISAVSPYAVAFATSAAAETGKEAVKRLWQWIHRTIEDSGTESDKEVLESFEQSPEDNQTALVQVVERLSPTDDATLRRDVEKLIQEVQDRGEADLISLLDNPNYYIFNDLKRICSRIDLQWDGEVGNQTRESLSRWVVNRAKTKGDLPKLIAIMLQINPRVVLQ